MEDHLESLFINLKQNGKNITSLLLVTCYLLEYLWGKLWRIKNNSNHDDIINNENKFSQFLTLQKKLQIIFLKAARNSLENKP